MRASSESLERAAALPAGLATALILSLAACSGCQSEGGSQRGVAVASTAAPPRTADTVAPAPTPAQSGGVANAGDSIGVATMDPDGTIVLQLRAEGGAGTVGDAQLRYPPSHKEYKDVLTHLGGLKPGESKPVPPWP
jgi:hypothetical protein